MNTSAKNKNKTKKNTSEDGGIWIVILVQKKTFF